MSAQFEKNSTVGQLDLFTKKLKFELSITGNAVAASKTSTTDLPGIAILRTEGITAAADALEAVTWTAAHDEDNAIFGVLLDASQLGTVRRVKDVRVSQVKLDGSTCTCRPPNNGTDYKTTAGNIGVEILASGMDLDETATRTVYVEVTYELSKM